MVCPAVGFDKFDSKKIFPQKAMLLTNIAFETYLFSHILHTRYGISFLHKISLPLQRPKHV